jgi:hypothetical protein
MLLIEAALRASPLDGIGLFAVENLPAGTPIWERDPILNAIIDISLLPMLGRQFIWKFAWIDPDNGDYVLDLDDSRFINHDDQGVLTADVRDVLVLKRDLKAGEEITWPYDSFDRSWYRGAVPTGYTECACGAIYRFPLKRILCPKCERLGPRKGTL